MATFDSSQPDFMEILHKRGRGALGEKMDIRILEASPERMVGTMPVEGNTQPIGLLHGGASLVLAETLGSVATQLHAGVHRRIVGIEINGTHHKSATSGLVTGVATAITLGKTLCCHEVVITNEAGERICTARITNLILAERS
ncbi:MAG: hypothetical protein RJB28_136 [Actinomycetota bacterium]|jgi:1,4-dihydroxy-2-naphthoyl-CoA hydrolase|nr:hotdog fold thioesterase [Actinomycetota bacterium]NDF10462.1 hotdog fold thioesterase [Actinomycetota bacterium]